jgi:hypothetical protein
MSNDSMNDDELPATRGDLRKLDIKLDTKLEAVERRLSVELAQHANAIIEARRSDMRAILDPKPRGRSSR